MPFMEWNDDLSVGVDLFDEHHKVLIGLINELYETMGTNAGTKSVKRTVQSWPGIPSTTSPKRSANWS